MEGPVQTGHVVSDLHVFAPWSVAGERLEALRDAADRSDYFVFNGDIFDFRWRTREAIEDAVEGFVSDLVDQVDDLFEDSFVTGG